MTGDGADAVDVMAPKGNPVPLPSGGLEPRVVMHSNQCARDRSSQQALLQKYRGIGSNYNSHCS